MDRQIEVLDKMPKQAPKQWWVYLLRCQDQSLYCGITNGLDKRLRQHNGEIVGGAKYTHARRPCQLVYQEKSNNRSEASIREAEIKKLTRPQKERLLSVITKC